MTFLKWDFIASKMNIISIRKRIVDTDIVSDVTCWRQSVLTRKGFTLPKSKAKLSVQLELFFYAPPQKVAGYYVILSELLYFYQVCEIISNGIKVIERTRCLTEN